ncbi:MAG: HD domain-containing protein [Firmicutes bacterium]|nr:HD domain-containing protein [Bacillota bacterium]
MYEKQMMLHDAIVFATEKHVGQKRKGVDVDYICHPLEVLSIVTLASPRNTELQIAAVLHDVCEDCDVTVAEIRERFGDKVAGYVDFVSDDPYRDWRQNKQILIDELKTASADVSILKGADTLSNLRAMAADLKVCGEGLWDRFRTPKEDICWYYREKLLASKGLKDHALTKDLFFESLVLFEEIFGETIFQRHWC